MFPSVHFQDLDFDCRFAWCRQSDGTRSLRWVPFGMPRLRQAVPFSTFYLYGRSPSGELRGPKGTGVFVARRATRAGLPAHLYAVTAYHVAVSGGASTLRINTTEKIGNKEVMRSRFIEHGPEDWQFVPGGDDIAVLDLTDEVSKHKGDFAFTVPEPDFVSVEFIKNAEVGPGEDGFMAGLFLSNPGADFNIPAVRFGNISQGANFLQPIKQGNKIARPSYVFDMHSRPGFSGSPVWIYRTPATALTGIRQDGGWDLPTENNVFLKLLGIHSGQFLEDVTIESGGANDDSNMEIPSSMTVVAPAWAITEALDLPKLKEQREMREKRIIKERGPRVRAEIASSEPATDNPTHKEDFMSLLDAAAKEKPKASKT
jgi:hypothetical protein